MRDWICKTEGGCGRGAEGWGVFRFVMACMLLGAVFALFHVRLAWTDGDEGRYLSLAHAVANGFGQVEEYMPEMKPETLSPTGYVHYLAVWVRTFGMNLGWVRLSSVLPFALFVGAFAWLVVERRNWPRWIAGCIVVFGAFQVQVLRYAWNLMSETSFLFLAFLCLAIAGRRQEKSSDAWLAGVVAAAATLVRPVGIALALAGGLHLLLKRKWKSLVFFCVAFGAVYMLEIVRTWRLLGVPFAYMTHYQSDAPASNLSVLSNMWKGWLGYFFRFLPDGMFFSFFDDGGLLARLRLSILSRPLMWVVAALVGAGWLRNFRKPGMAEWFWLFYWAMFCTYNMGSEPVADGGFRFQARYLAPAFPLAAIYFAEGLDWLCTGLGGCFRKQGPFMRDAVIVGVATYALLTSIVVGGICLKNTWRFRGQSAWSYGRLASSGNEDDLALARYAETAGWAATNLPTNAVIGSRKPQHTFLFSRRKGFRYEMDWLEEGCRDVWANAVAYGRYGPVYLLQDAFPATGGYGNSRVQMLDPAIAMHGDELELVYATEEPVTRLWLIRETSGKGSR